MKAIFFAVVFCFSLVSFSQPYSPDKYDKLTDSLLRLNKPELLTEMLEKEVVSHPNEEDALRALAYAYLFSGKSELCEKYYLQALKINPKCLNCWINIGSSYVQRENKEKAYENIYKAIEIDPKSARAYCMLAKTKFRFNEKAGALMDYNKAIELEPENADMYYERSLYNSKQGFSSMALKDMSKALELCLPELKPTIYLRRAELFHAQGQNQEALKDLNSAISIDSTVSDFFLERGVVFAELKKYDNAFVDYKKCASLDTNNHAPLYNLSLLTHNIKHDMDASCNYRHKTVSVLKRTDPKNPIIREFEAMDSTFCDSTRAGYYYQRAISASLKTEYQKALDICNANFNRFPNEMLLVNTRGDIYYYMKKFDKAKQDYASVMKMGPSKMMAPMMSNHPELWNMSKDSLKLIQDLNLASVWLAIAQCDFALGKINLALSEMNTCIGLLKLNLGETMEAPFQVRGALFLAKGNADSALIDFERALTYKRSPKDIVSRAVARVCLAGKIVPDFTSPFRDTIYSPFTVHWILPEKGNFSQDSPALTTSLRDCNNAIESDPKCAYAYFIRGQLLRLAGKEGFCSDFEKAKELGFVVHKQVLKSCKK